MKIRRRKSPALVGLAEAGEILDVKKPNVRALPGMPEPLQDRGIDGFAVSATPIWPRTEVVELAAKRKQQKSTTPAS